MKKILFAGFILFFLFLLWNSFNAPFERDEGHYAYSSWIMTKGMVPYIDTTEQKTPLIFYTYLLAYFIDPNAYWPPRLLAAIFLFLTLGLVRSVVVKEYGERAGDISLWLGAVMVMFPHLAPFAANSERFIILPLMGMLAIYVHSRGKDNNWAWFWAAVCAVISILYKQIAAPAVLFIFACWLWEEKGRLKHSAYAIAGGLSALVIFTGYFIARGALPYFLETAVQYNAYYIRSTGGFTFVWFAEHLRHFIYNWSLLFLLLVWFFIKRPGRWWFYFGLMMVVLFTVITSPYGHYYIMLMPFWAIVSAIALDSFIRENKFAPGLMSRLIPLVVIFSMFWPVKDTYLLSPNKLLTATYSANNPFVEAPLMAAKIREQSSADDYLYVAGSEMELNYYARRLNPTRFMAMYGMMMDQPLNLRYQRELIATLQAKKPKLIVWVQSPLSWLVQPGSPMEIVDYLRQSLKKDYRLVGATIRRDDIAAWDDHPATGKLSDYSLLLFKRKVAAR